MFGVVVLHLYNSFSDRRDLVVIERDELDMLVRQNTLHSSNSNRLPILDSLQETTTSKSEIFLKKIKEM